MWFKAKAPVLGDFEQLVLLGVLRLEMKGKAIEQARPVDHATATLGLWRTDSSILKWLETL